MILLIFITIMHYILILEVYLTNMKEYSHLKKKKRNY